MIGHSEGWHRKRCSLARGTKCRCDLPNPHPAIAQVCTSKQGSRSLGSPKPDREVLSALAVLCCALLCFALPCRACSGSRARVCSAGLMHSSSKAFLFAGAREMGRCAWVVPPLPSEAAVPRVAPTATGLAQSALHNRGPFVQCSFFSPPAHS